MHRSLLVDLEILQRDLFRRQAQMLHLSVADQKSAVMLLPPLPMQILVLLLSSEALMESRQLL
jgi:hypothetical protein